MTATLTVPAKLVQPLTIAVTEYIPVAAVVALGIEGFCKAEVKLFGPVHAYVAPETTDAVRFKVEPAHIGLLLEADGAVGIALTVTLTVPGELMQPANIAVTEYVPVAKVVALVIEGFCKVDVKPLGPVQLYVAPGTFDAVRFKVEPEHIGLLLEAVGPAGPGLTVTSVDPAVLVHPFTVAVTK